MRVVIEGKLRSGLFHGRCGTCACVVECDGAETRVAPRSAPRVGQAAAPPTPFVVCPTHGCGKLIWLESGAAPGGTDGTP